MSIAKVIGSNIDKSIKANKLKYEEVAKLLGVTRQTLNHYITGETVIDSAKLFKLSKIVNMPLKSFLVNSCNQFCFMFRADNPNKNFLPKDYNFVSKLFNDYFDMLQLIGDDRLIVTPESYRINIGNKIQAADEMLIKEIAENERKILAFKGIGIKGFYEALEKRNINIIALSYDNLELDAISAYSPSKGAFIFINDHKDIPEERKLFSLIHEYAHLLLHRDLYTESEQEELAYCTSRKNINEQVANKFASYFLIPRDRLRESYRIYRSYIDIPGVISLKQDFGVSAKSILLALKDEELIKPAIYGHLNKQLNQAGYELKEPSPLPYQPNKNQRLVYILKELYLQDKITTNKVAEVLNIKTNKARIIVKEWTINE